MHARRSDHARDAGRLRLGEDALIEQGFAPAYAEGYDDGCASGSAAAGGLFDEPCKDAERYATDTQYTQGLGRRLPPCPGRPAAPLERRGLRATRQIPAEMGRYSLPRSCYVQH